MFNHARFRDELQLSGVNSINWARIAAQAVYYFTAAVALGAPHRRGVVLGADRQFRRRARRLRREAHGAAGRAADGRDQRQRHPRPHAHQRPLRDPRRDAHDLAIDGHPGLLELRAPAVRGPRPRRRRGARAHGGPVAVAFLRDRARAARTHPAEISPQRRSTRRRSRHEMRRTYGGPPATSSIRTRRSASTPRRALIDDDPRTPVVALATAHPAKFPDAVERATRRAPGAAAASRRPDGPARALRAPRRTTRPRSSASSASAPGSVTGRRRMNQHFVARGRPRARGHDAPERPDGRDRAHAAHQDGDARRLGRGRLAQRARGRARPLASHRAHGLQGHAPPLRPPDRRGHRERRRRDQRRDLGRVHELHGARPRREHRRRARRARRHPDRVELRGERARAREGRHPAGIRRRRGRPRTISSSTPSWRRPSPARRSGVRSSAGPRPSNPSTARPSGPSWRANTRPERMVLAAAGDVRPRRRSSPPPSATSAPCPQAPRDGGAPASLHRRRAAHAAPSSSRRTSCSDCPAAPSRTRVYYATHMFAHVLGGGLTSRLWHEVREQRGLAYEIGAFHWPFSDTGLFGISAGTAGLRPRRARRGDARLRPRRRRRHRRDRGRARQDAAQGGAARGAREPRPVASSATPASFSPGAA